MKCSENYFFHTAKWLNIFILCVVSTCASGSENPFDVGKPNDPSSETSTGSNVKITTATIPEGNFTKQNGSEVVPRWIKRRSSKVLIEPTKSQLQIHKNISDSININQGKSSERNIQSSLSHSEFGRGESSSKLSKPSESTKTSNITGTLEDRQKKAVNFNTSPKRRLRPIKAIEINKKQDFDLTSLITEAPPVELTSVSPIESSFGGLTGLQGLPPLSLVQFIKLLVAVTPFMIPIVFVPLLIFTIGIFMIPVTRSNIFLDVDNLRSFNLEKQLSPTWYSYVDSIRNFTSSVVLPRAVVVGREFIDHENCVERISCEISSRYLRNQWDGNWRSVANKNWFSRTMNHFWKNHPVVSRVANSLSSNSQNHDSEPRVLENREPDIYTNKISSNSSINTCFRYHCKPISLLRKMLF